MTMGTTPFGKTPSVDNFYHRETSYFEDFLRQTTTATMTAENRRTSPIIAAALIETPAK